MSEQLVITLYLIKVIHRSDYMYLHQSNRLYAKVEYEVFAPRTLRFHRFIRSRRYIEYVAGAFFYKTTLFVTKRIGGFHVTQISLFITQVKNKIAYHSIN